MKILHLCNSDSGGAGRAAYRIHKSLINIGLESKMWVNISQTSDKSVLSSNKIFENSLRFIRSHAKKSFTIFLKTKNKILHSPAVFPSFWVKKINESDFDIVNLHWVQHEMLSVSDISKIKKPLVWTLHDMWGFCGAEHVSWDNRWKNGYNTDNRPDHESGFDINRWTWLRKVKYWKQPIQIITPSNWLTECVQASKLMKNWPCITIPNTIDTEFWKSTDMLSARSKFNLPKNKFIVAFGSSNANHEPNKGFELLINALNKIHQENLIQVNLVIFGQKKTQKKISLNIPTFNVGYLNDKNLRNLYCAANAVVVPSKTESFGQIAGEASACETPVISFNTSGLKDIIKHLSTGYLAKKFDTEDLSYGIKWVLENSQIKKLGYNARRHVINKFDSKIVAKKYLGIYNEITKS